jgi:hypothetical protein
MMVLSAAASRGRRGRMTSERLPSFWDKSNPQMPKGPVTSVTDVSGEDETFGGCRTW